MAAPIHPPPLPLAQHPLNWKQNNKKPLVHVCPNEGYHGNSLTWTIYMHISAFFDRVKHTYKRAWESFQPPQMATDLPNEVLDDIARKSVACPKMRFISWSNAPSVMVSKTQEWERCQRGDGPVSVWECFSSERRPRLCDIRLSLNWTHPSKTLCHGRWFGSHRQRRNLITLQILLHLACYLYFWHIFEYSSCGDKFHSNWRYTKEATLEKQATLIALISHISRIPHITVIPLIPPIPLIPLIFLMSFISLIEMGLQVVYTILQWKQKSVWGTIAFWCTKHCPSSRLLSKAAAPVTLTYLDLWV